MPQARSYYLIINTLFFCAYFTVHAQVAVIPNGHAHNDYLHKRPLLDALDNGMFSVEADVFYEDGKFLVAHIKPRIKQKNTLKKLYLVPLLELTRKYNGSIYENGPKEFILMLDLKGGWNFEQLKDLEHYVLEFKEMLTVFENGQKTPGAVRIVLSGSGRGLKHEVAAMNPRYFSIDGGLGDIKSSYDANLIPRISASYGSIFTWKGAGKIPDKQKALLNDYANKAHLHQRKIRFWATGNKEKVWKELLDAGVDWINVDKLKKFKKFYAEYVKGK